MRVLNRSEIDPVKMATNPPESVINAGHRVINTDGYIYEYVGIGWIKLEQAEREDYLNIPQLSNK